MKGLQDMVDDAESRSRRNNVQILGIPERSEGSNPTQFVEQWLRGHVAPEVLTDLWSVHIGSRLGLRARGCRPGLLLHAF